jgi:hypothetical protein
MPAAIAHASAADIMFDRMPLSMPPSADICWAAKNAAPSERGADLRAFSGKVATGFPKENATNKIAAAREARPSYLPSYQMR